MKNISTGMVQFEKYDRVDEWRYCLVQWVKYDWQPRQVFGEKKWSYKCQAQFQ